jgi:hypothetical protein
VSSSTEYKGRNLATMEKSFFTFLRCECAGYIKLDESIEKKKRENLDSVDEIGFSDLLSMVTITGFI